MCHESVIVIRCGSKRCRHEWKAVFELPMDMGAFAKRFTAEASSCPKCGKKTNATMLSGAEAEAALARIKARMEQAQTE